MAWSRTAKTTKAIASTNNRLNFVLAIIFLLIISLIIKLFFIQIKNHDYYLNVASSQHELYAEIEPERGKIFIQDQDGSLYPIATNKYFIQIYAVPKDIEEPERIAETLYSFFKKEAVREEVEKLLELQAQERLQKELNFIQSFPEDKKPLKESEVRQQHKLFLKDPTYLELKELKREQMIEDRKKAIIEDYLKTFDKWNDPYEPLEKKVESELAKQFHLALISNDWEDSNINLDNLEFKNNKVYLTQKEKFELLDFKGIGYLTESYRYYLENNIGSHILGFTTYEKDVRNGQYGRHGQYGLEGFFDEELFGQYGSISGERGAAGLMIISKREYEEKMDGDDLVLTIERPAQFYACNRLNELAEHYAADSGSVIVMDPQTGAIIVMCSYPDYDPNNYNDVENVDIYNNPVLFDQYEPGSVFKAMTMAAAMDQNKVGPTTTYYDEGQIMIKGWPKPIKNAFFDKDGALGTVTMTKVLEESLNTGAIFAVKQIEAKTFADYVKKFGFGEKTGIELDGEFPGNIKNLTAKKVKEVDIAVASFGQGITVTSLQMLTAYAAIANGGEMVKPYLVKEIIHADGSKMTTKPKKLQRVISEHTAAVLSGMLASVVENGHSKGAQVPGYFIAGKTGTGQIAAKDKRGYLETQYNHTFLAFAPVTDAKFVVLIKFENPKGYEYASSTTIPLAHDIIEFMLNYWQIPQERGYTIQHGTRVK
ncbi:MAG: penicillin-binding protein 2 [bacterium]